MTAVDDLDRKPAEAVRLATSRADDAFTALAEIRRQLATARPSFIFLFVPNRLQPDDLAAALRKSLP
ncbi:FIST signal transduction protein, partial [Sinorhizobium meliloti]